MGLFKKKKKNNEEVQEQTPSTYSYDKEFKTKKIKVFVIIVNRNQGDFFVKKFEDLGVGASFVVYGKGTATREIYDILGVGDTKKDIVLSLVDETNIENIKSVVKERFSVSEKSKGIAFSLGIDSIAGVLIYKYLTNTKVNERRESDGSRKRL